MLSRTLRLWFSSIVREVDAKGFVGNYKKLSHVNAGSSQKHAAAAMKEKSNVLFCGHYGTGKLTILKAIGQRCEKEGAKVAYISADQLRANRLDGFLLHHFIGLRISKDDLPSQEQLEGTLDRHVRLVESTYASCLPSLCSVDVLILDALEKVDPSILLSMDAVCRRQRNKLKVPFGGLRVYAAADFWRLPVHPRSDTGGNLFQLEEWSRYFPKQVLLRHTHGQEKQLNRFTEKAFFGTLTMDDMTAMEDLSLQGKPEEALLLRSSTTASQREGEEESDNNDEEEQSALTANRRDTEDDYLAEEEDEGDERDGEHSLQAASPATLLNDDVTSNADAIMRFTPRFPRQPAIKVMPVRFRQLKQTEIGNFLVSLLVQSAHPVSFGLVDALSVDVGHRVHLLLDGQDSYGVPAGAVGEVMAVAEHFITVYFPLQHRTADVPRMRVVCYHPDYPEIRYEIQQFPLFPRKRLAPMSIIGYGNAYRVNLNGRRMADTNDLGNILARMRSFNDFTLRSTSDVAHLDGMVHEPTRIYYHQIMNKPLSAASEQWCRNCKNFVSSATFFQHWASCVESVRWCNECNRTVLLELLEPHQEKHQVVLCMDCGQGVEWRHWEAHRLSCGPMMREISPDNEFLPLRTRQLALELGLDKRDLHTMRPFTKSMLPKSRLAIE